MAHLDTHWISFTLSPIYDEPCSMSVTCEIDSLNHGQEILPKPGVPLEDWQLMAFNRTINWQKGRIHNESVGEEDRDFGTHLIGILLSNPKWKAIVGSLLLRSSNQILFGIKSSDPELMSYPWEVCTQADWRKLELPVPANPIIIIRSSGALSDNWPAQEPIRILVAGVSANGLLTPNFDKEYRAINDALIRADLQNGSQYVLVPLRETTIQTLRKNVYQHKPHVIHMITHGAGGKHYVETSDGSPILISSSMLANALADSAESLCLFVSTACMSMEEMPSENTWGLGRRLSSMVPYVIGMQIAITEEAALAFTSEFYASLGASFSVLESLAHAQERIRQEHFGSPEWIAPVLYRSTSVNGVLFSPDNSIALLSRTLINYVTQLDDMLRSLRRHSGDGSLWKSLRELLVEIEERLVGSILTSPNTEAEIKHIGGEVDKIISNLRGRLNDLIYFLTIDDSKLKKVDIELKYEIGQKLEECVRLVRDLRDLLARWNTLYK